MLLGAASVAGAGEDGFAGNRRNTKNAGDRHGGSQSCTRSLTGRQALGNGQEYWDGPERIGDRAQSYDLLHERRHRTAIHF
jgi:hypothetical protein